MKKMVDLAFVYAIAAMIGGVFFREFTKFNGFTGVTALSFVHVHLFVLGMAMFLILALFSCVTDLQRQKRFGTFMVLYNIGLPFTVVMLLVRGVLQVLETPLSSGTNAAISGMAGIGHILLGAGIIVLLLCLKKAQKTGHSQK